MENDKGLVKEGHRTTKQGLAVFSGRVTDADLNVNDHGAQKSRAVSATGIPNFLTLSFAKSGYTHVRTSLIEYCFY